MIDSRFFRFLASGGVAALANFGSRIIFSWWLSYPTAIVLAWFVGVSTGFVLMRRFAFSDAINRTRSQLAWFVLINLLAVLQTLVISLLLARWLLPSLEVKQYIETIAHAVGVLVPVVTSYFGHKYLSFRSSARTL